MKIKVYADVFIGVDPKGIYFSVAPCSEPCPGSKRLSFEVEIPERYIVGEVENIEGTTVAEEDKKPTEK